MAVQGVIPTRILVHAAVPLTYVEAQTDPPEWIEGEPGLHGGGLASDGDPFGCVLFMPSPGGDTQNQYRPRVVRVPTLLYNPTREIQRAAVGEAPALVADHAPIVVDNEAELLITAPELAPWTGAITARWQADGIAQPFGRPGSVMGILAQLRRIED